MHIQTETETAWETRHPSHPSTDGQRTHCESVYPFLVFGLSLSLRLRFRPRHSWAKTVVLQQRSRQVVLEWWESSWEWWALSTKSRYCMLLFRWWRLWWRYRVLETDDGLCSIFPLYRNILNISEKFIYSSLHKFKKRWAHWISSTGTLFFCVSVWILCLLVGWPASNLMLIQKTRRQNVSPKFCRNLELQKSPVAWQLRRGTGEVVEPTSWYPFSSRFISYAGFCTYVHISSICSISSVCCYSNVFSPIDVGQVGQIAALHFQSLLMVKNRFYP